MKHLKRKTQQLKQLIKKYIVLLKLTSWEIDVVVSDKDILRTKDKKIKKVSPDYYAECIYDYLKKSASIIFTKLQKQEPEELEDTILHELLHVKFSPLVQLSESLVNVAKLPKEKTESLLCEIDESEHEIIETLTKLYLKWGKNGQ